MKNNAGHRVAAAAAGLSLIELMIALLISSILLIGVIQVFAASRTAYQLSQGIARNQENGRFAMDFLTRDIRMAGHAGCVNDQVLLSTDASGNPTGGNIRSLFLSGDDRDKMLSPAYRFRCDSMCRYRDSRRPEPTQGKR